MLRWIEMISLFLMFSFFSLPAFGGNANLSFTDGASYSFGTVNIGSSVSYLFEIKNKGSGAASALNFSSPSAPFNYVGGIFPGTGGNCSNVLNAHQTCSVMIEFSPSSSANSQQDFTVSYFNGSTNKSDLITMTGKGPNPALLSISNSPSYNFPNTQIQSSRSRSFTIRNSGDMAATALTHNELSGPILYLGGNYPGTGGTCGSSLAGGDASCTIVLSFEPVLPGNYTESLNLAYVDGMNGQILTEMLSGTATSNGLVTISSSPSYDFGTHQLGETSTQLFTLTNIGSKSASALSVDAFSSGYRFAGGSYPGVGGNCSTSLPSDGGSCTVAITFSPTASGRMTSSFAVSYFDSVSNQSVAISLVGTGFSPAPALIVSSDGASFQFPSVMVGNSADHEIVLTNSGGSAATLLSANYLPTPFSYKGGSYPGLGGDCVSTLNPGASCVIVLSASPTAAGSSTATLNFSYHNSSEMVSVSQNLNVTAFAPAILSFTEGASFDFGAITQSSADHAFTVSNQGEANATQMTATTLSGAFSFKGGNYPGTGGNCATTLAMGSQCTIVVSFTPTASGVQMQSFGLTYSDGIQNQSLSIAMSGSQGAGSGQLDIAFNATGFTTLSAGAGDSVGRGVAIQGDGKIVIVGSYVALGTSSFVAVRLNGDGSRDNTFGSSGIALINLNTSDSKAYGVAVQTDGKIVVAGYAHNGTDKDVAVARLTSSGNLDTTFNRIGYRKDDIGGVDDILYAIAIQNDAKIVVAGYTFLDIDDDFLVMRYTTTGTLDTPFNGNGVSAIDFGYGKDRAASLAIQADGKILLAGLSTGTGSTSLVGIARFNVNGSYDSSFGRGSIQTINRPVSSFGTSLRLSGTSIVIAGYSYDGSKYSMMLSQLTSSGNLDSSFAGTGSVSLSVGEGSSFGMAMAITQEGKIICGGYREISPGAFLFTLMRVSPTGDRDNTFGTNGTAETDLGGNRDSRLYALSLESNGKIIAVGSSHDGAKQNIAVVRFTP